MIFFVKYFLPEVMEKWLDTKRWTFSFSLSLTFMNKSLVLIAQPAAESHAALDELIIVAQKQFTHLLVIAYMKLKVIKMKDNFSGTKHK